MTVAVKGSSITLVLMDFHSLTRYLESLSSCQVYSAFISFIATSEIRGQDISTSYILFRVSLDSNSDHWPNLFKPQCL